MRSLFRTRIALLVGAAMALMVISAAPASAASALTVTPNTGLVDFQPVQVDGSGFPPNASLGLVQCVADTVDTSGCDLGTVQFPTADENGSYSTEFIVQRIITTDAGQIDCAPSNCGLFSSELDLSNPAMAPLEFDPNVPPQPRLEMQITVDPKGTVVSKTGEVTVRGTVTCSEPADVFFDVSIQQRAGRALIQGELSGEVQCDGTTQWSASGSGSNGIFKGGSAEIDARAFGSSGPQNAFAEVASSINFTGSAKH